MKELIEKLAQAAGPSGYETTIRDMIRNEVKGNSSNIKVDALGNLFVHVGEKTKGGLRIMLASHMDEIGIIVSHIEKNGLLRFSNIGTIFPKYLPGSHVRFLNGVKGVINNEKPEDPSRLPSLDKFFVDVGASSIKDCPVNVGDLAVFDREFVDLGQNIISKALDNRAVCALAIEVIRRIKKTPHELIFVFTTQEEVGSRGAHAASYGVDADLGIALDVTPDGSFQKLNTQCTLGGGPAIKVRDTRFIADPRLVNWMMDGARKIKIPYQLEVLDSGSTDAREIQVTKAGLLTGAISVPCRYVHSPSEMLNMSDYENTIKLLVELLSNGVPLS